eukprot:5629925-Ditylum_brightwellii.AAC.1
MMKPQFNNIMILWNCLNMKKYHMKQSFEERKYYEKKTVLVELDVNEDNAMDFTSVYDIAKNANIIFKHSKYDIKLMTKVADHKEMEIEIMGKVMCNIQHERRLIDEY